MFPHEKLIGFSKARKQVSSHQTKLLDLAHSAVKGNLLGSPGRILQEYFSSPSPFQSDYWFWAQMSLKKSEWLLKSSQAESCTQHIPQYYSQIK